MAQTGSFKRTSLARRKRRPARTSAALNEEGKSVCMTRSVRAIRATKEPFSAVFGDELRLQVR